MPMSGAELSFSLKGQLNFSFFTYSHLQHKTSLQFRKGQERAHWSPPTPEVAGTAITTHHRPSPVFQKTRQDRRHWHTPPFPLRVFHVRNPAISPSPRWSQCFSGKRWKRLYHTSGAQRQKVLRTEGGFIPKGLAVGLPLSHPVFLCTIETREQKICGRGEKETKKQEKNKLKKIF